MDAFRWCLGIVPTRNAKRNEPFSKPNQTCYLCRHVRAIEDARRSNGVQAARGSGSRSTVRAHEWVDSTVSTIDTGPKEARGISTPPVQEKQEHERKIPNLYSKAKDG